MVRPRTFAAAFAAALCSASACLAAGSSAALGASPVPSPYAIEAGEPWIAYIRTFDADPDRAAQHGVYLVRPDGHDRHLLLTAPAISPDWSPDGTRIVVESEPDDSDPELWIVEADGTDLLVVACDGAPCGNVANPAWSPDGGHLAFQRVIPREAGQDYDRVAIDVIDLTTDVTRVATVSPVADSEYVEYVEPRWSPDGTRLVFTVMTYPVPPTDENILGSSIAVVATDGSAADAPRILADPAMFGSHPDWSPDGEHIVFGTNPIGSFAETTKATNLYTVRPDGSDLTQITQFGENDTRAIEPTWTPDGKRVSFTHIGRNPSNPLGDRHIALIDADGTDLTLTPVPAGESDIPGDVWYGRSARMRPTP